MRPQRAVASFDSATGMLRALARFLRGRDVPLIGSAPPVLEPAVSGLFGAVNHLPPRWKEQLYSFGGWAEAVPKDRLGDIRAESIAGWVTGQYPGRRYPAVMIGSSNGAAVHLAAALGIPWLPQTLLIPVRQTGVHPDEPADDLAAGVEPARRLLDANPQLALHHMHDANQDRLMIRRMTYFRVKWLRLAGAYRRFLAERLQPGGTIFLLDCGLRWPTVRVGERHVFQHGALGGATAEEYQRGSDRVAALLARYGSHRRRWEAPPPDGESPEAEWGFAQELSGDLASFAAERDHRLRRIAFDHPERLSPLVADLYRWWYAERGLPADRLLVESFLLIEPWLTLRTASVPFWAVFNTAASLSAVLTYVDRAGPFDEIRAMLFSHGVDSVGLADIEQWRRLLARARKIGSFAGVDEDAYPRDFASLARAHRALAGVRARHPMPSALGLADLDRFLGGRDGDDHVAWTDE